MSRTSYPPRHYRIKEVVYNSGKHRFYAEYTDASREDQEQYGNAIWKLCTSGNSYGYNTMLECQDVIKFDQENDVRIVETNYYKA